MTFTKLREKTVFWIMAAVLTLLALGAGRTASASVDEIRVHLGNGDRVSGRMISEEEGHLVLISEFLGEIRIDRSTVERVEPAGELDIAGREAERMEAAGEATAEPERKEPRPWEADVSIGYAMSEGNTVSSASSADLYANRRTDDDELTFKGSGSYASTDRTVDTQRLYGMVRYAFSFWERKWYNFYKFEADHDMSANIRYRLLPSTGIGYWFSDRPDFKAMAEIGLGYENTYFRNGTSSKHEAVLVPRAYLERRVFRNAVFSQEVVLYPSLNFPGDFRLHSATSLKNPLTDNVFLRLSFIDDYNSNPSGADTKRNDIQFVTSIGYKF